jgi:hypothetical protein
MRNGKGTVRIPRDLIHRTVPTLARRDRRKSQKTSVTIVGRLPSQYFLTQELPKTRKNAAHSTVSLVLHVILRVYLLRAPVTVAARSKG